MVFHIGNRMIACDHVDEEDGRYYVYQGGNVIMSVANVDPTEVDVEDGEIEHVPTVLEKAVAEAAKWRSEYIEVLADDEAKRARLERIEALLDSIGDTFTLAGLIQFVRALREIVKENTGGSDGVSNIFNG